MNENHSFMYKFIFKQSLFKIREHNINSSYINESNSYNKLGYTTFSIKNKKLLINIRKIRAKTKYLG